MNTKELNDIMKKATSLEIREMMTPGGNAAPYQKVVQTDDGMQFYSYGTLIATVIPEELAVVLTDAWNYSQTTNKYRNDFFRHWAGPCNMDSAAACRKAIEAGEFDGWTVLLDR